MEAGPPGALVPPRGNEVAPVLDEQPDADGERGNGERRRSGGWDHQRGGSGEQHHDACVALVQPLAEDVEARAQGVALDAECADSHGEEGGEGVRARPGEVETTLTVIGTFASAR